MLGLLAVDCIARLAGLDGAVGVSNGNVHSFESTVEIFDIFVNVIKALGEQLEFL